MFMQVQRTLDVEGLRELMNSDEYDFRYDLWIAQSVDDIRFADKEIYSFH